MKKTISKLVQKISRKYFMAVLVFIWLISLVFTLVLLGQPLTKEEIIIDNIIEEKLSYDYSFDVVSSKLYPNGYQNNQDPVIFTKLAKQLNIIFDASITSEKFAKFEGTIDGTYSLVALDKYKRDFELFPPRTILSEGLTNQIFNEEYHIDLVKLISFIKAVENETDVTNSEYSLIITLQLNGIVSNDNTSYEVNKNIEIPFEVNSRYIKFLGVNADKILIHTNKVEHMNLVPLDFKVFNIKLPILSCRYIFSIISAITFIPLFINITRYLKKKNEGFDEIDRINKKHKNKIIEVNERISFERLPKFGLKTFKALMSIAEEKDEPILKYIDWKDEVTYYYFPCSTCIYYYCINGKLMLKGSE